MANPSKTAGPRILTLDIETAPLEVHSWGIWEQNIGLEMIKAEWTILSFSAKWLDEKKVLYFDTGGRGKAKVRDDKELLAKLWKLLDEADIVVAQNGQQFDLKKINSRLVMSGFGPYSPVRVIDTMLVAKRTFSFTSNKLAWMSEYLTTTKKLKHKSFPGFELWSACLQDNPKAWAEMSRYNKADVLATEELYLKLRPWIEGGPNLGVYSDLEIPLCPKCGSSRLQKNGTRVNASGRYARFLCNDCGGACKARQNLLTPAKRKSLLGT